MWTDVLGNPVTLDGGGGGLVALNDFVEGFIASEARAANVLCAAGDPSPILQACAAALHMFAESRQAPGNARPFIDRAVAGSAGTTRREQRFIAAVAAWVDGDLPRAIALHEEQAAEFPRDLVSLKLGQYHLFNRGDCAGMLRIALKALPAAADVPYLHGMLAFAWEQCHALDQAEAAARQAIAMRRKEPWAHHALAHVMLTQGRIREGHAFLQDVSDTWVGLNSFMLTHNWWHQALFALELGLADEVMQLYDQRVWGVAKDYSQDQINAVSLLARMELAGIDVGDRWSDVAQYLAPRTTDQVLPFLDLQYLLGLARAGRPEADTLLHNIEARAASASEADRGAWQEVCVPAAHGLLAWARGEHRQAVGPLGRALPRMLEIGGSHAQRDLFLQVHRDAQSRSGILRVTLVLLPGLAGDEAMWRDQLTGLADRRPQVADVHMRHDTIEEMAAALLVRYPGPLVLCGASMGGMVAMEAARQAPGRVRGVALLGTSARPEDDATRQLREKAIEWFEQGRVAEVIEPNAAMAFHPDHADDRELVGRYLDFVLRAGAGPLVRQNRAVIARPDARRHLPALRCPVLVMCGGDDQLTPPALSEEIASLVPGAELVLLPRCGHMLTMEQPLAVNAQLRRWLDRLG